MERESRKNKYKYDNCVRVSYPNNTYSILRKWAMEKSVSIQDFQRMAMEHYIEHLERSAKKAV